MDLFCLVLLPELDFDRKPAFARLGQTMLIQPASCSGYIGFDQTSAASG